MKLSARTQGLLDRFEEAVEHAATIADYASSPDEEHIVHVNLERARKPLLKRLIQIEQERNKLRKHVKELKSLLDIHTRSVASSTTGERENVTRRTS